MLLANISYKLPFSLIFTQYQLINLLSFSLLIINIRDLKANLQIYLPLLLAIILKVHVFAIRWYIGWKRVNLKHSCNSV